MKLTWTDLGGHPNAPLLVLGPSLGTGIDALWSQAVAPLLERHHVVGWELPGHAGAEVATGFSIGDLADAVADGAPADEFDYAGDSVGGAVGLQLLLDYSDRVRSATLVSTGARIGSAQDWIARADLVRREGTHALLEATPGRWYSDPSAASPAREKLLRVLADTDAESYAAVCAALAAFDVRDQLLTIGTPVLAVAGADDLPTPPSSLRQIADGVQRGRLTVLEHAGHLPPIEQPARVAELLDEFLSAPVAEPRGDTRAAGMRVRREVLGDAHVDRASAAVTDLTSDFQHLITRYAWGEIWTRPGLDRRSRSMITLTALIARGHQEELAMHLRAARRNGLTDGEIQEVILQSAIYCGVPDANTAFRIAQRVLAEPREDDQ